MRKLTMFLAGMFAGALDGGVAALLLAPDSGEELRKKVCTSVSSLLEEGRKAAAARRAELQRQLEDFKRGTSVTLEAPPERIELE